MHFYYAQLESRKNNLHMKRRLGTCMLLAKSNKVALTYRWNKNTVMKKYEKVSLSVSTESWNSVQLGIKKIKSYKFNNDWLFCKWKFKIIYYFFPKFTLNDTFLFKVYLRHLKCYIFVTITHTHTHSVTSLRFVSAQSCPFLNVYA